jgi:hypothetical protein
MRAGLALVAIGLVTSGASSLPAPVTLEGVGGVTPGLTPAQVASRWGVRIDTGRDITPGCRTARISKGAVHGYALFENGRLGAVFFDRGVRTPSGIRIGSTVAQVTRAYGSRLRIEPHAYVRGGHYYFLRRRQRPHWQIRFDSNGAGRITQIAFGGKAARYIEGCA